MYVFSGWSPQVSAVTGNVTYQAQFSEVSRVYTITWKNGDTVLETDENVAFGATPVYNGPTPTKGQGYIFSGWSPAIASATADITYYAQFTDEGNKHIVIFYDEDGETELGRTLVENGETAIYPNVLPTKAPSAQSFFTFEKWVTEKGGTTEAVFTNITENKNVYAKYAASLRSYVVTFCDWDDTILSKQTIMKPMKKSLLKGQKVNAHAL